MYHIFLNSYMKWGHFYSLLLSLSSLLSFKIRKMTGVPILVLLHRIFLSIYWALETSRLELFEELPWDSLIHPYCSAILFSKGHARCPREAYGWLKETRHYEVWLHRWDPGSHDCIDETLGAMTVQKYNRLHETVADFQWHFTLVKK